MEQESVENLHSKTSSRFGFYSEYDISSTIIGNYPTVKSYALSFYSKLKKNLKKPDVGSFKNWINYFIPITKWGEQYLRNWNKGWLAKDLIAGITVALLEIPQGMSYASIAGFPPINGIYASSFPVFMFAIFSSAKLVAVGPVSTDSLMMRAAVTACTNAKEESDEYVRYGLIISFAAGVTLIVCGLLRLGFLTVLMSRPVMQGFVFASALIVISNQLKTIFGISIPETELFSTTLRYISEGANNYNQPTLVMSIVVITLLLIIKYIKQIPKWFPTPLIVMIISIIVSKHYQFKETYGIKIVGVVPTGIPPPRLPDFSLFFSVLPYAAIAGIIGYMDAIAMTIGIDQKIQDRNRIKQAQYKKKLAIQDENDLDGKSVASTRALLSPKFPSQVSSEDIELQSITNEKSQEPTPIKSMLDTWKEKLHLGTEKNKPPLEPVQLKLDANQEMFGYGFGDLIASIFRSQIISGSFSRTALLFDMEGHTLFTNVISGLICILFLTVFAQYLEFLPKCILSAIVVTAVSRLITDGLAEMWFLYRVSRIELLEYLAAFVLPLVMSLELGIVIAIGVSLAMRLFKTTDAPVIELGQIYGGSNNNSQPQIYYANLKHWKDAKKIKGIKIIEFRAELSFTNYMKLQNYIVNILSEDSSLKYVIICLVHTQQTDSTALRSLLSMCEDLPQVTICLSHLRKPVRSLLFRYEHSSKVSHGTEGNEMRFPKNVKTFISTHDAVMFCQQEIASFPKDDNMNNLSSGTSLLEGTLKNIADDTLVDTPVDYNNSNNNNNNITGEPDESGLNENLRNQCHVRNRFSNIPHEDDEIVSGVPLHNIQEEEHEQGNYRNVYNQDDVQQQEPEEVNQ